MKLRLRSVETKETLRIEVPTTCSIQQLRELFSQRIFSSSSSSFSSIHLSLNRKDELLSSSPEDSLQSLGVTSGDLIFFTLNPNAFSSETLTVQSDPPQVPRSEPPQKSPKALTLDPNSQEQQTLNFESVNSETLELNFQKEKALGLNVQNEKALELNTQKEEALELNTQMGETVEYMEVDNDGFGVDVGKSFSVPGFLRKVFMEELGDDGGRHHKLLVIAVHAVLLESGFILFDPVSNTAVNGFHLPEEWPSSVFKLSLRYTLPEIIGRHPVDLKGVEAAVLKFQSLGKFFNVYGSLVNGGGMHWVRVDEDELVPFLNVVWANCGIIDEINGKDGFSSSSPEKEVFKFWRIVKDRLALPLLIDICEKVGLELPPCFMRLPTDLKLKILESLPGVDIAKVGCVCSELRYLTSSDDLWKQKFVECFGNAEGSEGGSRWKEKFVKSLKTRKRSKTASAAAFMQRRRNYNPFRVPPIIGGEYDVWPYLGPFAPLRQPDRGRAYPRLRNPVPYCNLGSLGP